MSLSVSQAQVDAVGRQLGVEGTVTYISILTKEEYDSLWMCTPQTSTNQSMSPLPQSPNPLATPGSQVNVREELYEFWQPFKQSTWASPVVAGANDFYVDVWREAHRRAGLAGSRIREILHYGRRFVVMEGKNIQQALSQMKNFYKPVMENVVDIAAARPGVQDMVKGIRVGIGFGVGMEVVEAALDDEATLASFLGGTISAVDKAALTTGIAYALTSVFSAGAASFGMVAIPPLALFIGISIGVGIVVNALDEHYGLTRDLQIALAAFFEWDRQQTDKLVEWSSAQVEEMKHSVAETVDDYRQWLDAGIEEATRNFDEVMERTMQHPSLANPDEIRAAATQGMGLRFQRWMMGD